MHRASVSLSACNQGEFSRMNLGEKLIAKLLLIPVSVFFLLISWNFGDVYFSCALFTIYFLLVLTLFHRGTLSDPRILFIGIYLMYSIWFPIRATAFGYEILHIDPIALKESLNYSFLGAVVFILVANLIVRESTPQKDHSNGALYTLRSEKIIFFGCLLLVIFALVAMIGSGATSKLEIGQSVGVVRSLAQFSMLLLICIFVLRIIRMGNQFSMFDPFILGTLGVSVLYVLVTGERDILFRVLILLLLLYYDRTQSISRTKVLLLLASMAFIVPVSQVFKAVLLSGELNLPTISGNLIFSNEFISASRNLYSLVLYGVEHSYSYLRDDIARAFLPKIIFPDVDISSTTQWYSRTFRVENDFSGRAGWGFGFIAQGYLMGGALGVVFIMATIGGLLSLLYNAKSRSIYYYLFYVMTLLTAIYCIRADMANFLSQTFKVGGFFVLVLLSGHFILRSKIKLDR